MSDAIEHGIEHAIEFVRVAKHYKGQALPAIADLSFAVAAGEHVCIVGRTGCGKSTAANLVLGLTQASGGRLRVLGVDPHSDFNQLRGRVGCVFQTDRLLPWRSAFENVVMPLEILRARTPDTEAQALALLDKVGLAGYEHAHPHRLSGGMRQRVALARALITRPELMIADEAFGALDEVTAAALRADFQRLAKAHGQTVLQITHSLDEALAMADRILVFDRPGRLAGEFARSQWEGPQQRQAVKQSLRALIAGDDAQEAAQEAPPAARTGVRRVA